MIETADVVIIGGGIVGSSVAFHLAEAGCSNVLIIEREDRQGMGSTAKSMGGVRAQFATRINIKMSLYSIDLFSRFEEVTGHTAGYRPQGYLFVATSERHLDYLKANMLQQRACGLTNVETVTREDVIKTVPQLVADDVVGGAFCPTDGFVDPYSVMTGFAKRARERGVKTRLETEVTGIDLRQDRVAGVQTSRGYVSTSSVVNASGPWAANVARLAGVEIPVEPLRRQIVKTESFSLLSSRLPMVIDMSSGFHFRPEGSAFLLAWPDPDQTYGFRTDFDYDFIEKILSRAVRRVPVFSEAEVNPRRCWAGMYEMTPDHHAIIGRAPGVEGLFLANGFSGHGVMHSPATGKIVSELIIDGKASFADSSALRPERFAEGDLLKETALL
ncbi:MAG TPA: FAD-dependent oxidoreductase [Blastocatellia bacterium]|nr:FAD-dependent oxidoreductase [Blastocatellia bacterium]